MFAPAEISRSSISFLLIVVVLATAMVDPFSQNAWGQDAAEIPSPVDPRSGNNVQTWPDETVLPRTLSPPVMPQEDQLPRDDSPSSLESVASGDDLRKPLPDETILPGATNDEIVLPAPASKKATENNGSMDGQLGELRPILRLDYPAHTSLIRVAKWNHDSSTFVTAGNDKDVHVWNQSPTHRTADSSDLHSNNWAHARTIRWQVWRGPRGRIYDAAISGNTVAIAGHGAMGGLGEIQRFDHTNGRLLGTLVDYTIGHRQPVACLRWSDAHDAATLASQDLDGRLLLWQRDQATGLFQPKIIIADDVAVYGEAIGSQLRNHRPFVSHCFCGSKQIIAPVFDRFESIEGRSIAIWRLRRHDLVSDKIQTINDLELRGCVKSLLSSEDGQTLVALDQTGRVVVVRFDGDGGVAHQFDVTTLAGASAISIAGDAASVVVASRVVASIQQKNVARLQWWRLGESSAEFVGERFPPGDISAVSFDPIQTDRQRPCAVATGSSVRTYSMPTETKQPSVDPGRTMIRSAANRPATVVRFSEQTNGYGIEYWAGGEERNTQHGRFDLTRMRLRMIDGDQTEVRQNEESNWRLGTQGGDVRLFEAEEAKGRLPLRPTFDGVASCFATLKDKKRNAVVVGTSGRNNLYVYRGDDTDPANCIRQFRGHGDVVRSIDVSADGRYAVSASNDATIAIWNLEGLFDAPEMVNRWGLRFEINRGNLTVTRSDPAGPMYFRGIRVGDVLRSISWSDEDGKSTTRIDGDAILKTLTECPFSTLVTFQFDRLDRPMPAMQSYPAWQPLATLFIDDDREWAYWTPSGFYDASFNGHRRFGWQINRGLESKPDFFRAEQFRHRLERPDVMRELLKRGSLPEAFDAVAVGGRLPPSDRAIVSQIRTRPVVEIVSPKPSDPVEGRSVTATVHVTIAPTDGEVEAINAFVSGVPALAQRLISVTADGRSTYEFEFELPSESTIRLDVIAAASSGVIGTAESTLKARRPIASPRNPRMHVLAIGVGRYDDSRITSLQFASPSAQTFASEMQRRAGSLYDVQVESLTADDATSSLWKVCADSMAMRVAQDISADDLVVLYFCGHGLRDRRMQQWYFVPRDADYGDLMSDRYASCLSLDDLEPLAALPCRKLAIIDSCHSGAIQSNLRQDDLKSLMRFLQSGLVMTVTASEGQEEAAEIDERGLGRFTAAWIDAISGQGDLDQDGVVGISEAIDYVQNRVSAAAKQEGLSQHPTASPLELIQSLRLPISRATQPPLTQSTVKP